MENRNFVIIIGESTGLQCLKKLLKNKEISEDEVKKNEKIIQEYTDKNTKIIDDKVISKEKDIMTI